MKRSIHLEPSENQLTVEKNLNSAFQRKKSILEQVLWIDAIDLKITNLWGAQVVIGLQN